MKNILLISVYLLLAGIISSIAYSYPRNMFVEYSTSTSCSHCPCMDSLVEHIIMVQFPGTNAVAYHKYEGLDPFADFRGKGIVGALSFYGMPMANIDRSLSFPCDYDTVVAKASLRFNSYPTTPVGLTIVSQGFNPNSRILTITVKSVTNQTLNGVYCLTMIIYENNLMYQQLVGECGGGPEYIHNLVAREISNNSYYGDTIVNGAWNANTSITKTYSTYIKPGWAAENCKFVFALYKLNENYSLGTSEVQQTIRGDVAGVIGIKEENEFVKEYSLSQNYPNPFNPITNVQFSISNVQFVTLKVYDMLGNEVAVLCNQMLKQGTYNAEFDASKFSSGTYFYRLRAGEFTETKRMVILK